MSQIMAHEFNALCCHHVDVEDYKCALSWWRIHEHVASGGVIGLTNPWDSNKLNPNGANFLDC
jgi:hypothetical protein